MAKIIKTGWFGRKITIWLSTGKKVEGELTEVADEYLVIDRNGSEMQVMGHAIVAISGGESGE